MLSFYAMILALWGAFGRSPNGERKPYSRMMAVIGVIYLFVLGTMVVLSFNFEASTQINR